MTDAELLSRFAAGTLSPEGFDHAEHVRLVWLQVCGLPLLEVIRRQCEGLERWTRALGVPQKYHETITVAFVLLVFERAARSQAQTWTEFRAQHPELTARGLGLLHEHYAPEHLDSAPARARFAVPSRASA